jgi:hypothetical protein
MGGIEIIGIVGGCMLAVVSYFLKRTMDEIKEIKDLAVGTKSRVEVLESESLLKNQYLNEKFDNLSATMKDLTQEIKSLRNELHEKKTTKI